MKRKATLLTSLLLCLAVTACATGIELQLGELVEGTLSTDSEFTSWNSGSYYETYHVDLEAGVQYRVSLWTDGNAALTAQPNSELGGLQDLLLTYHPSDGQFFTKKAVFKSGGTWYFFPFVRSPNIDPGEVHRYRFKVERL
jgi:hypothetical protein